MIQQQIFVDNLITEIKSLLGDDDIGEDEIESLLGDDIADDAKLAFLLLIEQKKGEVTVVLFIVSLSTMHTKEAKKLIIMVSYCAGF